MSRLVPSLVLAAHVSFAQAPAGTSAPTPPTPDCPEQDATVCGRRHFEAGTAAFEKNDYKAAAAEFEAALKQRPHPVIRFNLAISMARLGHPSAAIEQLKLVQADAGADKELVGRAERERKDAERALSRVSFRLADPTREQVELDGNRLRLDTPGDLAIDPGPHHVRIISGNSVVLDQDLDLAPGERVELRVGERSRRIDVVVVPDAPPPKKRGASPPPAPPPSTRTLSPVYFIAGASATAVLAGVTIWSGLDTKSAYRDYQRDLPTLSQAEADERVGNGHSRELRTNLLLAGSLVCAAGTAALGIWFVDFSGGKRASVGVTPNGVALAGKF
ncbi:MAG TPA: tetratricopeptide repeat protein [Polyangiaceae bacterium]|nr:tetratricopeptide repeat protein [Polyangiaceae bacterium]